MKVSVALVTYNQKSLIQQAVDSALNQSVDFDYEIVVGDDGSTDGTREVLRKLADRNPDRIRLLLIPENMGDHGRTNFTKTLEACTGEYVALLDGDDYWSSSYKLQRQVDFLDEHQQCALSAHRVRHEMDDGTYRVSGPSKVKTVYGLGDLLLHNFAEKVSVMLRRSAISVPPWYMSDRVRSGDWVLCVIAATHGDIGFIHDILAVHREYRGNISSIFGPLGMQRGRLAAYGFLRPHVPGLEKELNRGIWKTRLKIALLHLGPVTRWAEGFIRRRRR